MTTEQTEPDTRSGGWRDRHKLDIRVLGSLRVLVDDVDVALGSPKERALLAALALDHGVVVTTDKLVELLWGQSAPRTAAHSLQVYVSRLRALFVDRLGAPLIETQGRGYRLDCADAELDLARFGQEVVLAREALAKGATSDAVTHLEHLVDAWSSTPLEQLALPGSFEETVGHLERERDWAVEQLALTLSVEGSPERALELAQAALGRDALREPAHEAAMLALYRLGRSPEALRSFARYRQLLVDELGVDPSPRLFRLHERMLVGDPQLLLAGVGSRSVPAGPRPRNPYKGPRAFTTQDAEDFFGREPFVDEVMQRLSRGRKLIAVVGPSGSGKSSVLAAGLLPRLRQPSDDADAPRRWIAAVPGAPAYSAQAIDTAVREATLGAAGDRSHSQTAQVVLVLDRFESVFEGDDGEAARVLDLLSDWADGADDGATQVTTVLALRADQYDRPLQHSRFAPLFADAVLPLLPLSAAQLEESIVQPALRAGVGVESALLTSLIADVGATDSSLPLLQFVLADLFDQQRAHLLTHADYVAVGGVRAALARRAEEMRTLLAPAEQDALTQVCLRLFRVDGPRTNVRWMSGAELGGLLDADAASISHVVAALEECRLVVLDSDASGAPVICLGHEAILTAWPWLADLADRARPVVRQHESLVAALEEWELSGRREHYLWRGARVQDLLRAFERCGMSLTEREQAFLDAGLARDRRAANEAAAAERHVAQARRAARRRLQFLVLALVALLVVAGAWASVMRDRPVRVAVADVWSGRIESDVQHGVDQAALHGGVEQIKATADMTDGGKLTQSLASAGAGLVITSTLGADIPSVAAANPDTTFFAYADGAMPAVPNVTWAVFADQQTAYLAGAAGALASTTGRIGFLGGADTAALRRFEAGYVAGARAAVPTITVDVDYITQVPDYDGFASPSLAALSATAMLRRGVDVVYAASGASQTGTFQAVIDQSQRTHHQLWAIGADDDAWADESWQRTLTSRDHILTSTVKRLDLASMQAVRDFRNGALEPGMEVYDLANGGLSLATSGDHLKPYQTRLDELRQEIISGRIIVPCVPPGTPALVARAAQDGARCRPG